MSLDNSAKIVVETIWQFPFITLLIGVGLLFAGTWLLYASVFALNGGDMPSTTVLHDLMWAGGGALLMSIGIVATVLPLLALGIITPPLVAVLILAVWMLSFVFALSQIVVRG